MPLKRLRESSSSNETSSSESDESLSSSESDESLSSSDEDRDINILSDTETETETVIEILQPRAYALISLYDKTGIDNLARFLVEKNYQLLSTGGTYEYLKNIVPEACVTQVSDLTGYPSILEGRVKTLHPKIFGGILGNHQSPSHISDLEIFQIPQIDIVIVNLYPFHLASPEDPEKATELIDIGGVCLLRAAAKNCQRVTVLSQPVDYQYFIDHYELMNSAERQRLATQAFRLTSAYDRAIADYFTPVNERPIMREYLPQIELKYGCNPHQSQAMIYSLGSKNQSCPLKILNGQPGYINIMDALNGWGLVREADQIIGLATAASFKHTSPAGVGCSRRLSVAFNKARQSDPKSSFGDFIALSRTCNLETAQLIKLEVSDGVIAPDYEPEALEILKTKKGGNYLILKMDREYQPNRPGNSDTLEFREMYGLVLSQTQNSAQVTRRDLHPAGLPYHVETDLLLANVTLKYAQSNNIVLAKGGQVIGVAAGQQSRIDAVRLAGQKAEKWFLRQHPRVQSLNSWFTPGLTRTDKINLTEAFLDATEPLDPKYFRDTVRPIMEPEYKKAILDTIKGVSLASDAFFPFRDNIDEAWKYGVDYIIQPGGSRNDQEVMDACREYDILMVMTGLRMFTH